MKKIKYIAKDVLYKLYVNDNLRISEICTILKCGRRRLILSLKYHDIKITIKRKPRIIDDSIFEEDKDNIIHWYTSGEKNSYEIADMYNVSQDKVLYYLKRNNVSVEKYNAKQTRLKNEFIEKNKQNIFDLYIIGEKSCEEIGELFNKDKETIRKILCEFGVDRRDSPKFNGEIPENSATWIAMHGSDDEKNKLYSSRMKYSEVDIDEKIKSRGIIRISNIRKNLVKLLCLHDGYVWDQIPSRICYNDYGCPLCKYKNERITFKILLEYFTGVNIEVHKFLTEYVSDNVIKKIFVDFYIEVNDTKIVIEYNGIQHYKPTKFANYSDEVANNNFIKQKNRDDELRKYCFNNNIKLIEIDGRIHKYESIKNFLIEELNKIQENI
jgi:very-short-patch-repair endonuclease/predicted DNA-binding protein YlxM (UPF0122 family)